MGIGLMMLGERVGAVNVLGIALTIVGIALISYRP